MIRIKYPVIIPGFDREKSASARFYSGSRGLFSVGIQLKDFIANKLKIGACVFY